MTLILRSENDPHSRRIMTGGHYSTRLCDWGGFGSVRVNSCRLY